MEINVFIGERLKQARETLGLSQTEFAQIAETAGVPGATRQSQAKYEKGLAMPGAAYLAALAAAGVDVLYVLTGQRMGAAAAPQPAPALDTQLLADAIKLVEQLLVKRGRTFTPAQKAKHVVALYQAFASGSDAGASAVTEALMRAA